MPVGNPVYTDYQTNADDNQASPPIGAPEGNFKGSFVNDIQRHMMAVIRRLGDASLLASGGVFSAASQRITALAAATGQTDAVNLRQLQTHGGLWCGTSAGSANAQTLTPTPAITSYVAGSLFRCIVGSGLTNTGSMAVSVSGIGDITMRDLYGNALTGGEWRAARRHTFEFDGTFFRLLDPANWMDQALYDLQHPVGDVLVRRNTTNPNTILPKGITATWTRTTDPSYLRIADGTPGSGGSLTTAAGGDHNHGGLTGTDNGGAQQTGAGGQNNKAQSPHSHPISASGTHTHSLEPTYYGVAVWVRTA